jgi:hypothetical protein
LVSNKVSSFHRIAVLSLLHRSFSSLGVSLSWKAFLEISANQPTALQLFPAEGVIYHIDNNSVNGTAPRHLELATLAARTLSKSSLCSLLLTILSAWVFRIQAVAIYMAAQNGSMTPQKAIPPRSLSPAVATARLSSPAPVDQIVYNPHVNASRTITQDC